MYTVLELFPLFILKLWQTFCPLDRGVQSCPGRSSCACLQTKKTESLQNSVRSVFCINATKCRY
uniref:Uncharacterized protein n=1 Tax=Anguilla anguilla TaxID=7936 RepID=A0A0E9SSZ4_ANGAN